jgi:hypothetical protein
MAKKNGALVGLANLSTSAVVCLGKLILRLNYYFFLLHHLGALVFQDLHDLLLKPKL